MIPADAIHFGLWS